MPRTQLRSGERVPTEVWVFEPPDRSIKIPRWQRALLVCPGTIYAPAALSPLGEERTCWLGLHAGANFIRHEGHIFYPLDWLEQQFPEWTDFYAGMRDAVKRAQNPGQQ